MYTYAFLPNPTHALRLPDGIAGSLLLLRVGELAAVVEPEVAFGALQASDWHLMQAVLAHDRVIRELFQQIALLPLRFGTHFVSQQGLQEHLETHQAEYVQKLANLQGKAEYFLKLVPIAPDLQDKDDSLSKQAFQTQTEYQQILKAIARQFPNWVQGEAHDGTERVYVLGDRIQERLLYEALRTWQILFPRWEVTVGEPLPPYHFV